MLTNKEIIKKLAPIGEVKVDYNLQKDNYKAYITGVETKDSPESAILSSAFAMGKSPNEALNSYLGCLRGKVVIKDAMTDERREYIVI